ncbi:MAG: translesion DNA synthesis-associated protein ImuA [Betaproteobacteria bacterium]|nr:translesion DNA synthesis-associated protein ImuA [Betaproteobacteria bacterium]
MTTPALAALLQQSGIWRGNALGQVRTPSLATGFASLDAELPGGGWPTGAVTEILPAHQGIGELRLLGPALARLTAGGLSIAWIAPPYLPYPPALLAAGIGLSRLVIIRTCSDKETLWATEQALAANACGAVLAWPGAIRYQELRRLQLAAEAGQALAMLFRSASAAAEPSPAALRITLATASGGLAVHILKRRGTPASLPVLLAPDAECPPHRHALDIPAPAATASGGVVAGLTLA